jgi:hypothetical protein
MYKYLALNVNKSALNWTKVCQLHYKTLLHETMFVHSSLLLKPEGVNLPSEWRMNDMKLFSNICNLISLQLINKQIKHDLFH